MPPVALGTQEDRFLKKSMVSCWIKPRMEPNRSQRTLKGQEGLLTRRGRLRCWVHGCEVRIPNTNEAAQQNSPLQQPGTCSIGLVLTCWCCASSFPCSKDIFWRIPTIIYVSYHLSSSRDCIRGVPPAEADILLPAMHALNFIATRVQQSPLFPRQQLCRIWYTQKPLPSKQC